MKSADLSERVKSLSPTKRKLLSKLLEDGRWDASWLSAPKPAPATSPVEASLVAVWQEVLGRDAIGVDDNFFDLGGDSILSIRIVARAQKRGLKFTSRQLFEHPTVAALAALVTPVSRTSKAGAQVQRAPVRARGQRLTPRDFPDAELTQTDLDSILAQVAREAAGDTSTLSSPVSQRTSLSSHRSGGDLPRVQALRAARF